MGWADLGTRTDFGHPDALYFKANTGFRVRLTTDVLPRQVFYHACRDEAGNFLKARCIGSRQGCRFCEANNAEQYVKAPNAQRPYPFRSEYVGPVWVYELSQFKLLVGKQVWEKGIKPLGVFYKTLVNRDLQVARVDTSGQTSYTVMQLDPSEAPQFDLSAAPDPENYVKWLDANAAKVMLAKMGIQPQATGVQAPQVPTGTPSGTNPFDQATLPAGAPATQPATPPAQAPVVAGTPPPPQTAPQPPAATPPPATTAPADDQVRKGLQAEFSQLMAKKFDPVLVQSLIGQYGQGKQLDQMDSEALRKLIADYKVQAQIQ